MKELIIDEKPYPYSVSFRGAVVRNANFKRAILPASDFRELKVEGPVDFYKAEVAGSDFRGTDLSQFDFTEADTAGIIIDEDQLNNLKGVKKGTIVFVPDESKPSGLRQVKVPGKLLDFPPLFSKMRGRRNAIISEGTLPLKEVGLLSPSSVFGECWEVIKLPINAEVGYIAETDEFHDNKESYLIGLTAMQLRNLRLDYRDDKDGKGEGYGKVILGVEGKEYEARAYNFLTVNRDEFNMRGQAVSISHKLAVDSRVKVGDSISIINVSPKKRSD